MLAAGPVETEPVDIFLDGVDVLDVLLDRVGVVEAEIAVPAELDGNPEVQADGLRVPDVQVPVGFRREPRDHTTGVPRRHVGSHDLANEVLSRRRSLFRCHLQTSRLQQQGG